MANCNIHHNRKMEASLTFAFFLIVAVQSDGRAATGERREGATSDWLTHKPVAADVSVWTGEPKSPKGDCPTFATLLDQKTAQTTDGRFYISIGSEVKVYEAVFCNSGYFPRIERQIDSEGNGKVQPVPVRLYPRSSDAATFKATTKDTVRRFVSDISYLARSRPDAFREAVEEMRKSEVLGPQIHMGLDMYLDRMAAGAPHSPER